MKLGRQAVLGAVLALMVISGCIRPAGEDGISIMFDRRPLLFEETVYFNGIKVGKVGGVDVGAGGITRVNFIPADEFRSQLADNLVFYVSNGRLMAAKIRNFGRPLKEGGVMCGFGSRSALYWFRLKHALGDAARVAAARAASLAEQFQG